MLMPTDRKPPAELKIGDVFDVVARDEAASGDPGPPAYDETWPVDWYAIQTKPGREMTVAGALHEEGYRCFLPKRLIEIRLPGKQKRLKTVQRALYPRYVFAGVPRGLLRVGKLYHLHGVATVLSDPEGRAMRIKPGVVEELIHKADANGVAEITGVPADHLFSEGMVVGFRPESLFEGFRGTVVRVDSNGMIKIHIDSAVTEWPTRVHYSELLPPESG